MLLNLFCIVFGRSLFGRCIVWPSSIYDFWLPIWYLQTFDHCIICPSIYGFWLPLWYLQTFVHCIVYPSIYGSWLPFGIYRRLSIALSILQSTVPDYPLVSTDFCHCLSFNLRFLITLWYLQTFVHCIVYPSIYGSWLPFGIYRLLSLSILQSTVPDYPLVSIDFYYCQMDSGNSSNISTLHIIAPQRLIKKTVSVFNQIIIQCCEYLFRYGIIRF
jgi:hypothetical protein